MPSRVSHKRSDELKRWLKRNKDATLDMFMKETGGSRTQYYHGRWALGIAKKRPALSAAMKLHHALKKQGAKKPAKAEAKAETKVPPKVEEAPAKAPEVIVEGNTPDFIWYEIDLLQRKLSDISSRLSHVMKVSQTRDADQKKMMRQLISENTELRVANSGLSQQVAELTEMINGTPV